MIKGFRCKATEKLWLRQLTRKFPPSIKRAARIKLRLLHVSESLNHLRAPPSNRLEELSGNKEGSAQYSDQQTVADLLPLGKGKCLRC